MMMTVIMATIQWCQTNYIHLHNTKEGVYIWMDTLLIFSILSTNALITVKWKAYCIQVTTY